MRNSILKNFRLLSILFLVLLLIFGWNYEGICFNEGLGWDGGAYYSFIEELIKNKTFSISLNNYKIKRYLMILIGALPFKITGISLNPSNLILYFKILNFCLLIGSAYVFYKITEELKINQKNALLGFILLTFNFLTLKQSMYYPVLSDVLGLFLSIIIIYAYTIKHNLLLVGTSAVSYFIFPDVIFIFGMILFIFSNNKLDSNELVHLNKLFGKILNFIKQNSTLFSIFVAIISTILWKFLNYKIIPEREERPYSNTQIILGVTAGSIIISIFTKSIIDSLNIKQLFNKKLFIKLFMVIGLLLIFNIIIHYSANKNKSLPAIVFIDHLFNQFYYFPFGSILNHFSYWGPVVPLLIYYFSNFKQYLEKSNLEIHLALVFCFILLLGTESRCYPFALSYLIYLFISSTKDVIFSNKQIIYIGISGLLISSFYRNLNYFNGKTMCDLKDILSDNLFYLHPAFQNYFMYFGYTTSVQSYIILAIIFIFFLSGYWFISRTKNA